MNADPTSLTWWATTFGPGGAIVAIVCLAAWRVIVWIGGRIDSLLPYLKDLLIGHVSLMHVMEKHLTEGAAKLQKVSDVQDHHGEMLKRIEVNFQVCDDAGRPVECLKREPE